MHFREGPAQGLLFMTTLHTPAITHPPPPREVQKEEPALRIAPGKAMFLWKWAADDVTPWYPIPWFLG